MKPLTFLFRNSRRFVDDESGVAIIFMALSLGVFVGMSAMAVDVARIYLERTRLQATADAAALAAVYALPNVDATDSAALQYARLNMPTATYGNVLGKGDIVIGHWNDSTKRFTSGGDSTAVKVVARRSTANSNALGLAFAGMFGQTSANINATSVAVGASTSTGCILVLNSSANKALDVSGSGSLTNPDCAIYVNSNSQNAVSCTGSCVIDGPVTVVGGVTGSNGLRGSPNATGSHAAADPLSSASRMPPTGSCSGSYAGGQSITAGPTGVTKVCSIDVSGGTLTMGPGVYYVTNKFSVSSLASYVVATGGVTIALQGNVQFTLSGGGHLNIAAPTSGPTAGIAIMSASDAIAGTNQTISGGSSLVITGAVYFPNQPLTVSGSGAITSVNCTELVADQLTISGSANLQSAGCPAAGTKLVGGSSRIRLVQ